jgi:hypothetical protein
MKSGLRCLVSVLAGSLGVTGAWGVAAVGCGGDDSQVHTADLPDGTTDSNSNEDAQSDVVVQADVVVHADALAEAEADAGPDADAVAPVADAGPDVAAFDGSAQTFPGQFATAWCTTIAACCGTAGDAATFNWQACYSGFLQFGFLGSGTGANLFDGGHVAFNGAQAQTCLNIVATADCSTNQLTSADVTQLFQSCYGAYAGTLATGSPCAGNIECAPGNFCLPVDGGVGDAGAIGLCQALAGDGGACNALGANAVTAQSVCSYRGSATNGLACQNLSQDAGTTLDPSAWTCQPQWVVGTDCFANQDCNSDICHSSKCTSAGNWASAVVCSSYVTAPPPDAGDGG